MYHPHDGLKNFKAVVEEEADKLRELEHRFYRKLQREQAWPCANTSGVLKPKDINRRSNVSCRKRKTREWTCINMGSSITGANLLLDFISCVRKDHGDNTKSEA